MFNSRVAPFIIFCNSNSVPILKLFKNYLRRKCTFLKRLDTIFFFFFFQIVLVAHKQCSNYNNLLFQFSLALVRSTIGYGPLKKT